MSICSIQHFTINGIKLKMQRAQPQTSENFHFRVRGHDTEAIEKDNINFACLAWLPLLKSCTEKQNIPCQLDIHQGRSVMGVLVNHSKTTNTGKMKPHKRKMPFLHASVNIFLQRLQMKMLLSMATAQMGPYLKCVSLMNHQLKENWYEEKSPKKRQGNKDKKL